MLYTFYFICISQSYYCIRAESSCWLIFFLPSQPTQGQKVPHLQCSFSNDCFSFSAKRGQVIPIDHQRKLHCVLHLLFTFLSQCIWMKLIKMNIKKNFDLWNSRNKHYESQLLNRSSPQSKYQPEKSQKMRWEGDMKDTGFDTDINRFTQSQNRCHWAASSFSSGAFSIYYQCSQYFKWLYI